MKKKKILFFHFDLQGGGAEKVLINLISHLDKSKYDITIQTIFGVGTNRNAIPKDVHFKCIFKRLFRGVNFFMKLFSPRFLYKTIVKDKYDVEIGYLETSPTRIISGSNNKESKKYAWVHIEIEDIDKFLVGFRNRSEALTCYNKLDAIYCVSDTVKQSFLNYFPDIKIPVNVVYNVNDYDTIYEAAKEQLEFNIDKTICNICSVGRLTSQKRYDRLIRAASKMRDENFKFHIYILGEGADRPKLEKIIAEQQLNQHITLLGYKDNPYKYVSKMDLFVCSSSKEGYSTAVSEAIALNVPVLTTNVSGMNEILHNGKYGLIVNNDEQSLIDGLRLLLNNKEMILGFKKAIEESLLVSTESLVNEYERILDR